MQKRSKRRPYEHQCEMCAVNSCVQSNEDGMYVREVRRSMPIGSKRKDMRLMATDHDFDLDDKPGS